MLSTAMTTALPPISADLSINVAAGQWLTSGYSLAMGIIMPLTAYLIRRFPTKRLYLGGILIFIAGLVISLFAGSFFIMMSGRILQACGNGILLSVAQVAILTIYPPEKKGTVMGWYGLASGAAPVIAPTLAGLLVDLIHWRAIFGLALIVMIIALIVAWFVFADVLETGSQTFDARSFILSVFAFGGLTLGIGNISTYGPAPVSNLGMYFLTLNMPVFVAAMYNVIRCIAIGCLMMPLITWGTSHVKPALVADATALLTSLRTIAGAIGSAVFVGIMSLVSSRSVSSYGEKAAIHGLNIAFLCMTAVALILLAVAVFLVQGKKTTESR